MKFVSLEIWFCHEGVFVFLIFCSLEILFCREGVNVQILCENNGWRKLDILGRIWLKHPRLLISPKSLSLTQKRGKKVKNKFDDIFWQVSGQLGVFAPPLPGEKLWRVKWHICVCYTWLCKAQMLHLEIIDCSRQSNVSHLWLSFGRIYQFVMLPLPPPRKTDTSFL